MSVKSAMRKSINRMHTDFIRQNRGRSNNNNKNPNKRFSKYAHRDK